MKKHLPAVAVILALANLLLIGCCIFLLTKNPGNPDASLVLHADTLEEVLSLTREGKPAIIAFGADYCPTCVNYEPYIKELNALYGEDILIRFVDTVEHEAIRKEFNMELIPSTLFFYGDGSVYLAADNIEVAEPEPFTGTPKHVSDTLTEVSGDVLGLDNYFSYGLDAGGNPVYCKYVGFLDFVQLKQLAEALLQAK